MPEVMVTINNNNSFCENFFSNEKKSNKERMNIVFFLTKCNLRYITRDFFLFSSRDSDEMSREKLITFFAVDDIFREKILSLHTVDEINRKNIYFLSCDRSRYLIRNIFLFVRLMRYFVK